MKSTIRVGNAQAFWGDRSSAAAELLSLEPDLDYLTMDYLAEVSMSILALQRERDSTKGYAQDFVEVIRQLADYWNAGGKCRLIVNAGGLQPLQCALACQAALENSGCRSLKIGVVQGDDVLHLLKASKTVGNFSNLDSGQALSTVQDRLITANAYLGANGIVAALRADCEIVITGRVADPSMVVAAAIHAFAWSDNNWNALAGATVAGHLLECGTHATGGISTDWLELPSVQAIGFPIAEINSDGSCILTKSQNTGGAVSEATVKEQLVYEIGNPSQYISPDCHVSFLNLSVREIAPNRISVSGALGAPPPSQLKVSATYRDGYRAAGHLTFFGPNSVPKARRCGQIVLQRLQSAGWQYRDTLIECLGSGDSVPVLPDDLRTDQAFETVLRVAVEASEKAPCEAFAKELIPLVTAGPQGTTGYAEGRPNVHAIFRYWPCLIDSTILKPTLDTVVTNDTATKRNTPSPWPTPQRLASLQSLLETPAAHSIANSVSLSLRRTNPQRLFDIAYGRSGDKGTGANIGILARDPRHYVNLTEWLTAEKVHQFFAPLGVTDVVRYELPNLHGLNFVVRGILKRVIRNDVQGKALAQALLTLPLDNQFPLSS